MTDNQNSNKRKSGKVSGVIAALLAIIGAASSGLDSCECGSDFDTDDSNSSNDSLLADFDYDFNMDDFDFSIFDNDYEFDLEYEEEQLHLRVNKAVFDEDTGILTAVIENYGNGAEDGLPAIIMKESKDSDDYICCVYPDSYYENASESLNAYLDYRTLILPQTEVTLTYQLQSYELEYLQEAIEEYGQVWVTFYKDTLEDTFCPLEME